MPKRNGQPSSCPEGWIESGIVIPIKNPSKTLQAYTSRAIGQARFVYNLARATHKFHRQNHMPWPSAPDLASALTQAKKEEYSFLNQCSKFVAQGALADFEKAINNWRDPELPASPPKAKKKNRNGSGSFLAASGVKAFKYDGKYRLKLPCLESFKLLRKLPPGVIPVSVRIKRENGQILACVNYYQPPHRQPDPETQSYGGLDVGINPLTSWEDSNGNHDEDQNPRAYYQAEKQLRRWQRSQSRRAPGSNAWNKAQKRIDKLHRRVKNLRKEAHHLASKQAVMRHHTLGIETLNVRGMLRNGHQAKALSDAAISGLLHKIKYKAERYGTNLVLADQWYPSSKTCSHCGHVNRELKREKEWTCPACQTRHDRNRNAARNLLKLALGMVTARACIPEVTPGESSSSSRRRLSPPPVKLETFEPGTDPIITKSSQLRLIA